MNEKHRIASKYRIRIEYFDEYDRLFDRLNNAEMCGIDSRTIPFDVPDHDEWLRFCQYKMVDSMQRLSPEDRAAVSQLMSQYISTFGHNER